MVSAVGPRWEVYSRAVGEWVERKYEEMGAGDRIRRIGDPDARVFVVQGPLEKDARGGVLIPCVSELN